MVLGYAQRGIVLIISDILSLITIVLCLVAKVPQIQTIYKQRSTRGISLTALYLEVFSYTVTMSYNYCYGYFFLSYLEYPILLLQDYILLFFVLKYKHRLQQNETYIGVGVYLIVTLGFLTKILPSFILAMLVPFCTPIGATSKVMSLVEILRTKDSTSVSLMTWFLSAFTNLTRIYTVSVDSADWILLSNFGTSFILSSCVYAAAFFYKKPKYRKFQ